MIRRTIVLGFILFGALAGAQVAIDSTRQTAYDFACVNGAGTILSGHQRYDKAQAACATRKLQDPDGVYEVQGGRWRITFNDALAQVLIGEASDPPTAPANSPPVWDSTPAPVFAEGVAASYDLTGDFTDADGDTITIVNETGCTLPTGVTIDDANDELDASGSTSAGTTTSCVFSLDDGTASPVNSSAFSIVINASASGFTPESGIGLTGTVGDGNTLTVTDTGDGFGGDPVLLAWDDFEWGSDNTNLDTSPNVSWTTGNSNGPDDPEISDTRAWSGTRSGMHNQDSSNNPDSGDSETRLSINTDTVYVRLWYYFDLTSSPATQKGVRMHADDGPNEYTSYPGVFFQDFATSHRATISPNDDSSGQTTDYGPGNYLSDGWNLLEYWVKLDSTTGEVKSWLNLSLDSNYSGNTRSGGVSDNLLSVLLPFYFGNGGTGLGWYDDVYISEQQTRLEICNNTTYASATKCTIQPFTSWGVGSISFEMRLQNLGGESQFLFHIDSSGSATRLGEFD